MFAFNDTQQWHLIRVILLKASLLLFSTGVPGVVSLGQLGGCSKALCELQEFLRQRSPFRAASSIAAESSSALLPAELNQ